MRKKIAIFFSPIIDVLFAPISFLSSAFLLFIRKTGIEHFPISKSIFSWVGILPIHDHYYQPLINPKKHLIKSLRDDRHLPGIDFNVTEQLQILSTFHYNEELSKIPIEAKLNKHSYFYNNFSFMSGDAEYLYNMIRYYKPKRIIEIGSGYSTLMSVEAIRQNKKEENNYECVFTCIEPYEVDWLEVIPEVKMVRNKVENINLDFFNSLQDNDILFIDSSHIIRPQGDVLYEYLQILPSLNSGVIIHVHDIFTPKDYLNEWIFKYSFLWNEQYLLEAFLTLNKNFKIIGALNYLLHHHTEQLTSVCPVLAKQLPNRELGSFWMRKV